MSIQQDIIIAGVGGQGILTITTIIDLAALAKGLHVKQSEVHGMAQRGGAVVCHLRLSSEPIASDLISFGTAQLILAMEPMEGLRYLPYLRKDGVLVANQNPVRNIPAYPDMEPIMKRIKSWPRYVILDAEKLARQAGHIRTVNSVILGATSAFLVVRPEELKAEVSAFFDRKGPAVVKQNLTAFDLGRACSIATP